uniref:Putative ixodes 10 kDa peptide protein n=1 Tax=Ixodes ricinus TaxID=34613 RepID=A0A0K8RMZ0_IXORI
MCRNISNMLLVLFAVLLILPESQGNGSGISLSECYRAVKYVGDIFCTLFGYGNFESLIYGKCKLVCKVKNVQLPKEACSNGSVPVFGICNTVFIALRFQQRPTPTVTTKHCAYSRAESRSMLLKKHAVQCVRHSCVP